MKRVLVPLDGSKAAERAIALIEQVCVVGDAVVILSVKKHQEPERTGAVPGRVIKGGFAGPSGGVMAVVRPDTSVFEETKGQVHERESNEARDYLEHQAAGLRRAGIEVQTAVVFSESPTTAILAYAIAMKPTFIAIVHTDGHSGLGDRLRGSTTNQIINSQVAPVLVIPVTAD